MGTPKEDYPLAHPFWKIKPTEFFKTLGVPIFIITYA